MRLISAIAILASSAAVAQPLPFGGSGGSSGLHPGYVVNNWYLPVGYGAPASASGNTGIGTAICSYGAVMQKVTINALGGRVTTLAAGGNVQFAVYNAGAWGRPSTLAASTASVSTAAAGIVSGAASAQIGPGSYWFCQNVDNVTVVLTGQTTVNPVGIGSPYIGSASQAAAGTGPAIITVGISVAQAFGAWPAFSSGTAWAEVATSTAPYVEFKIGSVP